MISYYAGEDLPVFPSTLFSRGERADLSAAERVEIRRGLAGLADGYRKAGREWARRQRGS